MDIEHKTSLTSGEIANLWTTYMNNSMVVCVLKYFLNHVEDKDIHIVLERALQYAEKNLVGAKQILHAEKHPIPVGFESGDVNLQAKRLFSDPFYLKYVYQMSKPAFSAYGTSTALAARQDVETYFTACLNMNMELCHLSKRILLEKGLYIRDPYIPFSDKVDFVKKAGFLTGWFGERKSLLAQEIMHLYHNIQTNYLGRSLILGFSQVAHSDDARDYFKRGKEVASKQIDVFSSILRDEDIPVPMAWDSEVLDSTESPFSDKLMMYHISILNAQGIGNYGTGMSVSTRRDLVAHFGRLTVEIGQLAEDGFNLMIKHGWLEEPPQATNRNKLIYK